MQSIAYRGIVYTDRGKEVTGLTDKLMTVKDLMEYLQVSQRTVYNLREAGLPTIKIGNMVRYSKDEVDKWIKEQNKEE